MVSSFNPLVVVAVQVVPSPVVLQVVISPPTSLGATGGDGGSAGDVQFFADGEFSTLGDAPRHLPPVRWRRRWLRRFRHLRASSDATSADAEFTLGASVADSGDGGAGGSASNVSGSISGIIVTKGDGSIGLNAQSVGGGGGAAGSVTNSASASGDASVAGSATLSFGGSGGDGGPQETSPCGSRFTHHSHRNLDTGAGSGSHGIFFNPSVVVVVKVDPSSPAMSPPPRPT